MSASWETQGWMTHMINHCPGCLLHSSRAHTHTHTKTHTHTYTLEDTLVSECVFTVLKRGHGGVFTDGWTDGKEEEVERGAECVCVCVCVCV